MDKGIAHVINELFNKHRIAYHNVIDFPKLQRRRERSKVINKLIRDGANDQKV